MMTSLFLALKASTTVLTPNQRLAATLSKLYNQEQINKKQHCWPTVNIHPLNLWVQERFEAYQARERNEHFLLLSANQELLLWEELIALQPESEQLLKLTELAEQARSAWSILKRWKTDFYHPSFHFTENGRHFQSWAEAFTTRCQEKRWLDQASLMDQLIEKIQQAKVRLPEQLLFFNFTELTPQDQTLLAACEEQGVLITHHESSALPPQHKPPSAGKKLPSSSYFQIALSDQESEVLTMASWAKKIHAQEPQARIGCIAGELEEKRELLISVFNEVFEDSACFNISAGKPLSAYPLIQQALQLLNLSLQSASFANLSALCHSPFIGEAETEMATRLHLESHLRQRNITTIHWTDFLKDPATDSCPHLSTRIQAYLKQRRVEPYSQELSAWLAHFARLLEIFGWPGEQSLNSSEYQVVTSWMKLLRETRSADLVLAPLPYHQALHYLRVLTSKTYFQPESPEAPIQILGQLEGAGLPFDYLWVMGLDDIAWPPVPSPNPFIPQDLQKALGMPNATANRQLAYSQRLMEQYKQAAKLLIFSYSEHLDNEERYPSSLLAPLPTISARDFDLPSFQTALQTIFLSQKLERYQDSQAPSLAQSKKIAGGMSLFEMQAACPFKAFAKLRLGAYSLEEPQTGLPLKNRGSVVHRALELFWKRVKNQQTLAAYSSAVLQDKIHQVLTEALKEVAPFIPANSLYYTLVKQGLESLLAKWLALEKSRPPFTVAALEQKKEIMIDHFSFTVRVDRIDEIASGKQVIIDYKTKKTCEIGAWFGLRPEEPQLPLYCISQPEATVGLFFAQLHPTSIAMKGLAQQELALPGEKVFSEKIKGDAPSWPGQLEKWRLHLTQLFRDFEKGLATVDPKNNNETCRYCDLHSLCRIHEEGGFDE